VRQGMAVFVSDSSGVREEINFIDGKASGKATLHKPDGSMEEVAEMTLLQLNQAIVQRYYVEGKKQGPARMRMMNGDVVEYEYKEDCIDGKAVYTLASGGKEISTYVKGVKHGKSEEVRANGDREERNYRNGVLHGPAVLRVKNGQLVSGKDAWMLSLQFTSHLIGI